jgi:outer membrane lipoprotein carrier protein
MPRKLTLGLLSTLLGLFHHGSGSAAPPAAPDANTVISGVQSFYDKTPDLTAEFKQHITSEMYGPQPDGHGMVYLKKGGKMLWDYDQPQNQQFISDGKTLWVYQPDDHQVVIQDLAGSALPTAVTFLTGSGNLAHDFSGTASQKSDGSIELDLKPKNPSGILDHLTLLVDPSTFQVRESIVYQTDGQTNDIEFDSVKTSTGLSDSKFSFSVPPGATVLDPSKMGNGE